ncbi:hypothetical protein K466DRAFT_570657 [Polyporus arcularius HHB13444]|uniref:Uncharacterized protein n=1 Tax=Polyporus arcularius HHB13444 TaxID=1314778 RepID=A0A5C3NZ43_9APHY|nr:hypothetical protein K466DRAFT_570657 [Polyporus arcularius HHB13444]
MYGSAIHPLSHFSHLPLDASGRPPMGEAFLIHEIAIYGYTGALKSPYIGHFRASTIMGIHHLVGIYHLVGIHRSVGICHIAGQCQSGPVQRLALCKHQADQYSRNFIHTIIDQFTQKLPSADGTIMTKAQDTRVHQQMDVEPQETDMLVDQNFRMKFDQIGAGEQTLIF